MTHSQAVATDDTEAGVLTADDACIPASVHARFGDYAVTVATVVPVIGRYREEWWLFGTEGALIDVLCRRRPADTAASSQGPLSPRPEPLASD